MQHLASLQIGEKAIIETILIEEIPLKLVEMGCLPQNTVEIVQFAPTKDPIYIKINDETFVAIRRETALKIGVKTA